MQQLINSWLELGDTFVNVYQGILRYVFPFLSLILLFRCARPLLTFRREPEIWAWLCLTDGKKLPITHWESVIGRSKRSDVVIDFPTVSKTHAVLTRYDDGSWTISDAASKGGVFVNGEQVGISAIGAKDVITLGGMELKLTPISQQQEKKLAKLRTRATNPAYSVANVFLLTLVQCLCCISYLLGGTQGHAGTVIAGFAGILVCQWALLFFYLSIGKPSFEVETVAFFLCTLGMAAIAAVKPGEAVKQLIATVMGLLTFLAVGWGLRDLERAKKMRYAASVIGVALLLITLVFGKEYHGAKNWLMIGNLSVQPSELSKVCFVFAGCSTMSRMLNKRNLILFIIYTVMICACLAVMNDFGTALIFFVAFLLIAYLRSGSVGTLALACTSLGFAGVMAVRIAPHAVRRFTTWRHIWEYPLTSGYQQTRALMCIASGGLFGIGAGKGFMKNVFAADSDVVFATLGEEWGLLLCLMAVFSVMIYALFSVRCATVARSSFYTVGACTAAGILVVQVILNALGTVDILPLTGVTFPFVSNGGSSMICAWGLLGFVKAADTRQNASFAVRQFKDGGKKNE